jgi:D-aminopeptidase
MTYRAGDLPSSCAAAVEATEEAVVTALLAAHDMVGRDGRTVSALPVEQVRALIGASGPTL